MEISNSVFSFLFKYVVLFQFRYKPEFQVPFIRCCKYPCYQIKKQVLMTQFKSFGYKKIKKSWVLANSQEILLIIIWPLMKVTKKKIRIFFSLFNLYFSKLTIVINIFCFVKFKLQFDIFQILDYQDCRFKMDLKFVLNIGHECRWELQPVYIKGALFCSE